MYVFKFFKNNVPVYVVIDDLLPLNKSDDKFCFAYSGISINFIRKLK